MPSFNAISILLVLSSLVSAKDLVMKRSWSWSGGDFEIYDSSVNATAYKVSASYGAALLGANAFRIIKADGTKLLQSDTSVTGWKCGFDGSRAMSNGVKVAIDSKLFKTDKWYVSGGDLGHKYEYFRGVESMTGTLRLNGQTVITVKNEAFGISLQWVNIRWPGVEVMTITTDESVPDADVLALLAVMKNRIDACGW